MSRDRIGRSTGFNNAIVSSESRALAGDDCLGRERARGRRNSVCDLEIRSGFEPADANADQRHYINSWVAANGCGRVLDCLARW